jgi:hypothetical protein
MSGSIKDTLIMLTLRMVGCRGPETGRHSVSLSNLLDDASKCNRAEKSSSDPLLVNFNAEHVQQVHSAREASAALD